jgi:hypothetical protein
VGALVERLECEYSLYLHNTWKQGAMEKILRKLAEREVQLLVSYYLRDALLS